MGTTGSKERADGSRRPSTATDRRGSNSGSSANGAGDTSNAGSMSMRDLEDMEDMPEGATEPEKMSWYTMMKVGYDQVRTHAACYDRLAPQLIAVMPRHASRERLFVQVVNSIIRPPRAKYTERDLGMYSRFVSLKSQ
jgi:hypothetical protein